MFSIYRYVTQTRLHTYLQYLSVFHCCVDIGVFISEDQRKVILSVKQKCFLGKIIYFDQPYRPGLVHRLETCLLLQTTASSPA